MGLERKQPADEERDAAGDGLVVEAVDLDGDGTPDGFVVTITEALDVDGDGAAHVVEHEQSDITAIPASFRSGGAEAGGGDTTA